MFRTLIKDLKFPTGVAVDGGVVYITESGLQPTGRLGQGRVLKITDSGTVVLADELRAPVTGLIFHEGALFVSEGGCPGRISKIDPRTGARQTLLDNLPGGGDYHTNTPIILGEWLYFGQGAATNSGIVSWDPVSMPWIEGTDLPNDLPGYDVELADHDGTGKTGAFQKFGTKVEARTRLNAQLPCTSGVMRCRLDGSELETVAWGFRNPFGLHAMPDGEILVVDLGMNDRGARPVGQTGSAIWKLEKNRWFGHPDFVAGEPVSDPKFRSLRPEALQAAPLIANHDELGPVPKPLAKFGPNSGPTQMLYDEKSSVLLVALFGDKRPITGVPGPTAGRDLVRIDLTSGAITACNLTGLYRPIDLCWRNDELLLLDFGNYELEAGGGLKLGGPSGALHLVSRQAFDASVKHDLETVS